MTSGELFFSVLDGSARDLDAIADGVWTIPGGMALEKRLLCEPISDHPACRMRIEVHGDLTLMPSSVIRAGDGLVLQVQGDLVVSEGALITSDRGAVVLSATGKLTVDGLVSAAGTGGRSAILSLVSTGKEGRSIRIGSSGVLLATGDSPGGNRVDLDGCGIEILGLLASIGNGPGNDILIRSCEDLVIDGRDLGQREDGRQGQVEIHGGDGSRVILSSEGPLSLDGAELKVLGSRAGQISASSRRGAILWRGGRGVVDSELPSPHSDRRIVLSACQGVVLQRTSLVPADGVEVVEVCGGERSGAAVADPGPALGPNTAARAQVAPSSAPPCIADVRVDNMVLSTLEEFEACDTVSSAHTQIVAPARVIFRAGESVVFEDGFSIEESAEFVATLPRRIEFRAVADCAPVQGARPFTAQCRSRANTAGDAVVRYRWDFEGDGVFDTDDTWDWPSGGPADYLHSIDVEGSTTAVLEVTNYLGETDVDLCPLVVTGNPPTAEAQVTPSNGPAPLLVNFTCTASDPEGAIALYEWDFDGDGTYDWWSEDSGSTTYSYASIGDSTAVCRVTDADGETALAPSAQTVVRVTQPGSPQVEGLVDPTSGPAPLTASLTGTGIDDGAIVLWEWDFDGDGSFEYSSPVGPDTSYTYTAGGHFTAVLRVTDDSGHSEIDTVGISVDMEASLSIPDDTFEPSAGETVFVDTTLSADAAVRVLIKDETGFVHEVLVDEFRLAGAYSDIWDGADALGSVLPEGPYYAVLEYQSPETRFVNHTDLTGGLRYAPPQSATSSPPFPLELDFTVPAGNGASEILAMVGFSTSGEPFLTLTEREPYGVGSYTLTWDGNDANGDPVALPPGESFVIEVLGFELPANAIMLVSWP